MTESMELAEFSKKRILGRTGLSVGRLGISSSFGLSYQGIMQAFEKGCNYFTWGTFIKGRSKEMKKAIGELIAQGKRVQVVLAIYSYAHQPSMTERFIKRGLKSLGTDYADVLILGYFPKPPRQKIIDSALQLKKQGQIRFVGISGHSRNLFTQLNKDGLFDIFHLRYNAAHRGAEKDVFPYIPADSKKRPGIVGFTATRWGQLINPRKMPAGERVLTATECYRFVLSHPSVDVVMTGTRNQRQLEENLQTLQSGPLTETERIRITRIGDHLYYK